MKQSTNIVSWQQAFAECDLIPHVAHDLNLATISYLLRCCKTFHDKYTQGIPVHLAQKYDQTTQQELLTIQFGVNRFLQQHPSICENFSSYEHTNALVHYAQTNNHTMFQHTMEHERSANKAIRKKIVTFFQGADALFDINKNIEAYLGHKKQTSLTLKDLDTSDADIARIFILNNTYQLFDRIALHYIAQYGLIELIPLALSRTNNINAHDRHLGGSTALHVATANGYELICTLLISYGADINSKNDNGISPLHTAAIRKLLPTMVTLLLTHKADINAKTNKGKTPLQIAIENEHNDIVKQLITHNAQVNEPDKYGNTPLHLATYHNNSEGIKILLENGAEINAKDNDGNTPLCDAIRQGHYQTVKLLIKKGADIHNQNNELQTPLHLAAQCSQEISYVVITQQIIELLIDEGASVNATDHKKHTPLHVAATRGSKEFATIFIKNKADINAQTNFGTAPLHKAVYNDQKDMVLLLINNGALINIQNRDGNTPLHIAACNKYSDIAQILIQHNADITAKNSKGETPLECALNSEYKDIIELLLEKNDTYTNSQTIDTSTITTKEKNKHEKCIIS